VGVLLLKSISVVRYMPGCFRNYLRLRFAVTHVLTMIVRLCSKSFSHVHENAGIDHNRLMVIDFPPQIFKHGSSYEGSYSGYAIK